MYSEVYSAAFSEETASELLDSFDIKDNYRQAYGRVIAKAKRDKVNESYTGQYSTILSNILMKAKDLGLSIPSRLLKRIVCVAYTIDRRIRLNHALQQNLGCPYNYISTILESEDLTIIGSDRTQRYQLKKHIDFLLTIGYVKVSAKSSPGNGRQYEPGDKLDVALTDTDIQIQKGLQPYVSPDFLNEMLIFNLKLDRRIVQIAIANEYLERFTSFKRMVMRC